MAWANSSAAETASTTAAVSSTSSGPPSVEELVERGAVDVLHDQERLVGVGVQLVDGHDGGWLSSAAVRASARPAGCASRLARVEREGEALDRDAALHAGVPREHHGAVAALAELRERAVAVENQLLLHAPPDSPPAGLVPEVILAEQPRLALPPLREVPSLVKDCAPCG